ncbi:Ig-like domain-containing protein [Methylobacter sp. YRD-M1]|uniref:Ig-like domain-containing protein n=1 Tax=Methylobacter sp. YRD-M1 TaxID=2911520 RepID=UPI00227C7A09|nr:Ig-like domain-containing protein [Methylobacter sp. YRD-M1]WAK02974.1 Ig-like domain-containing protein [Methylobacter sp. YRD-M1]
MNETNETIEVYDSYGVLIGYNVITNYDDGQGNTSSSTSYYDVNWNSLGGTSTSTDSQGYSYTSDWSTSTSTDSAGNTVQTYSSSWSDSNGGSGSSESTSIYDANWNQLSGSGTSSYSDGLGYSYTSDWSNSTSTDSAGNTVQTSTSSWSDSYGNSGSSESTSTYDANGNSWGSSVTADSQGYSYTSSWNNSTSTDSAGNTVQTYSSSWSDSNGGNGSSTWTYTYDASGQFIGSTYTDGITSTVYDSNWNIVSQSADVSKLTPDGQGGYFYDDGYGNITTYDANGVVTGHSSTYSYDDGLGNSYSSTSYYDANWNYLGDSGTSSYSDGLGYSYTSSWNNSTSTDSAGNTIQTYSSNWSDSYGSSGSSESTSTYDANGNSWGSSITTDSQGYSYVSDWSNSTSIDSAGNTVQTYSSSWSDSYGNSGSSESTSIYDANGNSWGSSITTDSQGYSYASDWSNSTSIDSAGNTVQISTSSWSDSNGGSGSSTWTYTYDASGQFVGSTYSDGITTTWYDSNGQIIDQVSSDETAPALQTSTPQDDALDVAVNSDIILTFDESILAGSGNIVISDGLGDVRTIDINDGSQVSFGYSKNGTTNTVTINPTEDLLADSNYFVQLDAGVVTDLVGNAFAGVSDETTLNFVTAAPDTTAPALLTSTPQDNALDIAVNSDITLTFDESILAGSGNIVISDGLGDVRTIDINDGSQVSFGYSKNGTTNTVTINPTEDLLADSNYFVQLDAGVVTDLVGNAFAGVSDETTLNFGTVAPDAIEPILQIRTPHGNDIEIQANGDAALAAPVIRIALAVPAVANPTAEFNSRSPLGNRDSLELGNGGSLEVYRDTDDRSLSIENDAVPENPITFVGVTDIAGSQADVLYSV